MESLTTMQAELTARWDKACAYMDSGKPYTEAFWKSMADFWAAMEVADSVERSLRRSGFEGCISTPSACAESAFNCSHCAGQVNNMAKVARG